MKKDNLNRNQIISLLVYAVIFLSTAIIALTGIFRGAGSGQVGDGVVGLGYFKPFTMDSNILAGISSLILIIFELRSWLHGDCGPMHGYGGPMSEECDSMHGDGGPMSGECDSMHGNGEPMSGECGPMQENDGRNHGNYATPRWAVILQLMGAACLSLTMLVAAFFLAPIEVLGGGSYFTMFSDDMFFFHLVNPVLSIIAFSRLQKQYYFQYRECILGAIPTIIYSFVYLTMVVILKQWDDFYGFTFGGRYELIPAVFVVIYGIVTGASLLLIQGHNKNSTAADPGTLNSKHGFLVRREGDYQEAEKMIFETVKKINEE